MAASHRLAAEYGVVALFAAAADRFGVLRCALTQISDTLLFPNHHTPERLMRQVRDETRYRLAGGASDVHENDERRSQRRGLGEQGEGQHRSRSNRGDGTDR